MSTSRINNTNNFLDHTNKFYESTHDSKKLEEFIQFLNIKDNEVPDFKQLEIENMVEKP